MDAQLAGTPADGCDGADWDDAALARLYQDVGVTPDYTMAFLQW
jgi:hypothetical protein